MNSATMGPDSTSASLIERARDADGQAWERLSAIYVPLVYRWCRRVGLQDADAADVVQEVFRAVAMALATFEPGRSGGFRGWLFGIARNKLADHYRRGEATRQMPSGWDRDAAGGHRHESPLPPDSGTKHDAMARPDDVSLVLHAALDAIRDDFEDHNWQAFERTALLGEPAVDVAADLNLTPAAVRQAKFRILGRLRRELDGLL